MLYKKVLPLTALLITMLTFVACGSDEDIINEPQQPVGAKTYTMTVQASKGDGTRALALDGKTLNATWTEGDAVAVYKGDTPLGTLTAQSSGANTTLKGDLSGTIAVDDQLTLKFLSPSYSTQDGTLAYIASHCDYATATVTVNQITDNSITTTAADFLNQQAIVKFTLKDKGNSDAAISASKLIVRDGTNIYTVTPASATSEIYVAMPGFTGKPVSLMARVGDDMYTYKRKNVSFSNGSYFEVSVKMSLQGYVDLGLPSGTKWATCNIGAVDPEDFGDYYAWGATETWYTSLGATLVWKPGKEAGYVTVNAPYYSNSGWTKYNLNSTLQAMDDAANVNWGSNWRMPTAEQWQELRQYCSFAWTQRNGVNGALITRAGYSGELFLPAAGIFGTSLGNDGVKGLYFTASQGNYGNDSQYTLYYEFPAQNSDNGNVFDTGRYFGLSIRPVRNTDISG